MTIARRAHGRTRRRGGRHPRVWGRVILTSLVVAAPLSAEAVQSQRTLRYPAAHRAATVDTYHGIAVADPYQWMESLDAPELQQWMRAEDALLHDYFRGRVAADAIERRLESLRNFATQGAPIRRGDRTFYRRRERGATYGTLYVRDGDGPFRTALDLASLNEDGESRGLATYSPDGRYVTIVSNPSGAWQEVRIRRVDGDELPDVVTGLYRGGFRTPWSGDGEGFFYTRYPVPDDPQAPLGRGRIFYHEVGTPQSADRLVYERPDEPSLQYGLRVSHDGRYLVIAAAKSGSFTGMTERLYYIDLTEPDGEAVEPFAGVDAAFAFEGNEGTRFWIRTNLDAPSQRLVEVDLRHPEPEHWRELIPEGEGPFLSVAGIGNRLVVLQIRDARTVGAVYDFDGNLQFELPVVAPSMWGAIWSDDRDNNVTYYGVNNIVDGNTLFELNVETGENRVFYRPERDIDPSEYTLEQVFYDSFDGTRVPMYFIHKKGLPRDGTTPVFMYGYGFGGWSAFPWQGYLVPWLEMGGMYAVPNIRGGGEYGDAWAAAGAGRNKGTSIRDFVAAAEWLVKEGYTSPGRVVANGGSASGMLPAAAVNLRPGLFGAQVINYPTLDQLRFPLFGSAASWVDDFGDPNDPDDFEVLRSYSPYHNITDGVCYPPTWVQVGEKDETTTPMHGYKFAAALQAAQGCDNPVLLKISWNAGHTHGETPEQARRAQAEEIAFLADVMGLEMPRSWLHR